MIEFYMRETGESCQWQNIYVVDCFGCVFYDTKEGLVIQPQISFRLIKE